MKTVLHRPRLEGPAWIAGGLILGTWAIATLHGGIIESWRGDITAADDPVRFFGTILIAGGFAAVLVVMGVFVVRDAPATNRRMDRYLADRDRAQALTQASHTIALEAGSAGTTTPPDQTVNRSELSPQHAPRR